QGSSVNLLTLDKVSPLHEACVGGNAACAKLLIEKGAKVNSATVDWNTPLFNACVSGNVACVNLLLQHGAKPQAEYHLSSPIHEAASRGHTECLEALLHHGADIDHNIKHLGTPLYVACTKQNVESVKKLLELGANLNTEGDTPLHAATRASRPDLVQLLLEHGADVKARNTEGKEPLDLATPGSEARRILMQREVMSKCEDVNDDSAIQDNSLLTVQALEARLQIKYLKLGRKNDLADNLGSALEKELLMLRDPISSLVNKTNTDFTVRVRTENARPTSSASLDAKAQLQHCIEEFVLDQELSSLGMSSEVDGGVCKQVIKNLSAVQLDVDRLAWGLCKSYSLFMDP
ncbi:Ankyrin repeat and SOCS box protein 9, partial [Acipenser ruthenus]